MTADVSAAPTLYPPPRFSLLDPAAELLHPQGPVHLVAPPVWSAAMVGCMTTFLHATGLEQTPSTTDARTCVQVWDDMDAYRAAAPAHVFPQELALPPDNLERFALAIFAADGRTRVDIAAAHPAGVRMAIRTLSQVWRDGTASQCAVVDWPAFPVRGVIEGFYGEPWTPEARAGMLRFLAAHRFNTFVYGPKDDPYHRGAWREPYPDAAFAAVREQIDLCAAEGLRFVYCLAPGLDFQYSSDADLARICTKYRALYDAGVRHFGLLFDDIPYVFLNDADVSVYGESSMENYAPLGVAHAAVTAHVLEILRAWDADCTLVFCPVEYHGDCASPYVRALRDGLPADVDVFYTGPHVCSGRLETHHTRRVGEHFGRPITFWDNYPVNDASMTGRLHTNPITGRDPDLWTAARGLISNPMPQCEASKIALATIAAYLWAPERYDPAEAQRVALAHLVAPGEVDALQEFAEHMHFCCLHETESEALAAELAAFRAAYGGPEERAAAKALLAHSTELEMTGLLLERLSNAALRAEIAPWAAAMTAWGNVLRRTLALLMNPPEQRNEDCRQLQGMLARAERTTVETCGTVVADFARWALDGAA